MPKSFYIIYIKSKPGVMHSQVETKMNAAVDWFRINNDFYVVYTTSDEEKWQARLLPLVNPNGSLFVCKLDTTHYGGWLTEDFWKWFQGKII